MSATVIVGDCRDVLRRLPAQSIQCCVTSPPYFGLRDYGNAAQIGLEDTPDAYVAEMVAVFREVRRVLRDDGTLWLNLGDTRRGKQLLGIPWMVAFALQGSGWMLRDEIIWEKPNVMPENVSDRCTRSHETILMLSKKKSYFFDHDSMQEPATEPHRQRSDRIGGANGHKVRHSPGGVMGASETRNRRSVWKINTKPFKGAHFSTMPTELAEICVKAGSRPGDTVLDPFGGTGTTALAADKLERHAIVIEINLDYASMAQDRINRK
jgi:site-specific DNA-methyltransferase (adenine-specific)